MPRTRAKTKSRRGKETAENDGFDGSADEQVDLSPAETAPKSPNKRTKTPRGGKRPETDPPPPPQPRPEPEKVAGRRMSNVKHSGLLARDEVVRLMAEEGDEEDESLLHLSARRLVGPSRVTMDETEQEGEGEKPLEVAGREIFTIQNGRRSTKTPRMKRPNGSGEQSTPGIGEDASQGDGEETEGDMEEVAVQLQTRRGTSGGRKVSGRQTKQQTGRRNAEKEQTLQRNSDSEIDEGPDENLACGKKGKEGNKEQRDTAQGKRSKGKGRARNVRWRSDSDQEDSEFSEEDEEELDEEEMAAVAAQLNRGGGVAEHSLEDYFTAHTGAAGPTSDSTLSRLARPRLEQAAIQTALQDVPSFFQGDCQQLFEEYSQLYSYWLLQMSSGYNVLLYGLGSKKRLLDDFCKSCLSQSCHLVVNGYFPGLTLKQVLNSLSSDLLGHNGTFKSHTEHAQFIVDALALEKQKRPGDKQAGSEMSEIFLIIHNLDGPMLRSERAQAALSVLASSKCVHVMASVDHINSSLLWDQTKMSRFSWAWHDVTTFQTYKEETSYENSLLVQQSSSLALSSLTHVMRSLTPNARKIFELLAKYQLENKREGERSYQGLSFSECYRRCREDFLVNSDLTLRAQLTEFIDHKLVRSAKGSDGVDYLTIPVDDATLSQFLSEFND